MNVRPETLWNFSLRIYGQRDIAQSCLALQDRDGCDVNLLLFCCWVGVNFAVIPDDILTAAVVRSQRWNAQVVGSLRSARRWMKGRAGETAADAHESLRDRIKSIELEAERLQQAMLEHLVEDLPCSKLDASAALDAICDNLGRYLLQAGISLDAAGRDDLAGLLQAVLPAMDLTVIDRRLESL